MIEQPDDEKPVDSFARTQLAMGGSVSPPTEPKLTGDALEAGRALVRQVELIALAFMQAAQEASAITPGMQNTQRAIDAAVGVCRVLERCMGPRTHTLKTDPAPFAEVKSGKKRYEVRRFDRDFRVGDRLVLTEFDRATRRYSGDRIVVKVVHILPPGSYGLPEDIGVLGIEPLAEAVAA